MFASPFDADLMAINPDLLTVHFKPDCTYFAKSILEGKNKCSLSSFEQIGIARTLASL